MSGPTPDKDDLRWQQEQEASFERKRLKEKSDRLLWLGIVGVAVLIVFIYPVLMGIGPFGIKSIRADTKSIWVYNTTEHSADVDVAYNAPLSFHHKENIPPYGIQRLMMKAGQRTFTVTQNNDERTTRINLQHPTLITLGKRTCYAAFDVSEFYHGTDQGEPELRLVHTIPAGTFMYESPSDVMVVPRQALPQRVQGTIHWVEDFGCDLIQEGQEATLLLRARMKLEERQAALNEAMGE